MTNSQKIVINYVTSSLYKIKESEVLVKHGVLEDNTPIGDLFEFRIREDPIKEVLEVDLKVMVMAEVTKAYSQIRVPCIVEHAGLIFADRQSKGYPGGLTKPMWNALDHQFVSETHSAGRQAVARAVVAYCDGSSVKTFVGETAGSIAEKVRGNEHRFYWDSIFIPDKDEGNPETMTYAEIVENPDYGIEYKVLKLSQSTRAMMQFLEHRRLRSPELWPY